MSWMRIREMKSNQNGCELGIAAKNNAALARKHTASKVALPKCANDANALAISGRLALDRRAVILKEKIINVHDTSQRHSLVLWCQLLELVGEGEVVNVHVGADAHAFLKGGLRLSLVDSPNVA